ncbi:MAG: DUF2304 domain-containing protein [Clostridia bacterium]|nr:DUF2304 domain-containing protein [Clostridia bacterium]
MQTVTQIFSILIILLFNWYILHILRKELIEYQYALLLLGAGLGMLLFAAFPQLLFHISSWLGFGVPLNFIYFAAVLLILALIFQVIVMISRMRRSIVELIQEVSILKVEIQKTKEKNVLSQMENQQPAMDHKKTGAER